jgi:uncharacterized membrane protein YidH (DUF202 family)
MTARQVVGAILTTVGVVVLLWGGLFWTRHDTVIDAGPVKVQKAEREGVKVPPLVGGVVLVTGVLLLLIPSRVRS